MLSAEGQQGSILGAHAVGQSHGLLYCFALSCCDASQHLTAKARQHLLAGPFLSVFGDGMTHFVTDDRSQFVVGISPRASQGYHSRVDHNLTTGHTKSIELVVLDEVALPGVVLEVGFLARHLKVGFGCCCDALGDALYTGRGSGVR